MMKDHILIDTNRMNHDIGKSQKLNDDDMVAMQTLVADFLSMERGQSKAETDKEYLERNDLIIGKLKEEIKRLDVQDYIGSTSWKRLTKRCTRQKTSPIP